MNFRQKKEISRRIAKVHHIPAYRNMLKARGSADAGRIMSDKDALARSLVYNLLDFYSEEQILAGVNQATPAAQSDYTAQPVAANIKKKILKLKNILLSPGGILMTLWSALQTAYTLIVSTATALWQRLREKLQRLRCSIVKLFQK